MAAPTFVAEYEATQGWDDATEPKTVDVTTAVGDVLAILSGSANASSQPLELPTGGTGTYVNQEAVGSGVGNSYARIDTAVTGITAQTYTLSQNDAGAGTDFWGFTALRFSGSDGIGAAESRVDDATPGTPTLDITTTQANSALVVVVTDWSAVDGASRTWRTVNSVTPTDANGYERIYFRDSAQYTAYVAYYPDAGSIGAKTVGISSPGGQTYSIAAVEVLGTAGGGGGPVDPEPGGGGGYAAISEVPISALPEAADTFAGTGASTLAGGTSAGSGTYTPPAITGTGTSTLAGVTSAGAGTYTPPPITGTGSSTLTGVTSAGTGQYGNVTATGTSTLAGVTSAGSGTYTPPAITGTGSTTLAGVTSAGAGTHTPPTVTGTGSSSLGGVTSAGSGTYTPGAITGTGTSTLAGVSSTGSGVLTFTATGTSTLAGVTSTGSGTYTPSTITGTGASTLEGVTSTGTGTFTSPTITGTGSSTLEGVTSAGAGTYTPPAITGTGALTLVGVTSAGTGEIVANVTGTGASTLGNVTSAGSGVFSPLPGTHGGRRIWRSPGYGTHRSSGFGG